MKVLTRYILKAHIGPFFFAFIALTGVVLINTLAKSLADLAGKGLPTHVFFEFFILSLPANIALTMPMSMLVAVLYTFSQMAAENEITALKASGVDLRRMILPLILVAAMLAGGMVWFNDRVLPAANYRWRMLMTDVAQTSPLLVLREQVINPISSENGGANYYLRAGRIDQASNRMWDVTIYDVSNPRTNRTIYADSGRVAWNEQHTDLMLTLYSGTMREMQVSQPEKFQRAGFEKQVLRMPGVAQQLDRSARSGTRTDRDMTVGMMRLKMDTLRTQLREAEAMIGRPMPASSGLDREVEVDGKMVPYAKARAMNLETQIRSYEVEIQKKFSIAAATLVFVLIGVPLALRFPQGGIGLVIAASLTIFSIYYVGLIGGESLGNRGFVPPWIAMWLTNLLFGAIGLVGMWWVGRERSSGRAGGWAELAKTLRLPWSRRAEPAAES